MSVSFGTGQSQFEDLYTNKERLQSGSYGTVFVTRSNVTQEEYAVKIIDRTKFKNPDKDTDSVHREVAAMKELANFPGVIGLVDFFENHSTFYVVQELARGGDVFDKLGKLSAYTEKDARDLAKNLIKTVHYMHCLSIVHRDLKPENLLLKDMIDDTNIRVADFGFARKIPDGGYLHTRCGTPAFVAPEILLGTSYGKEVDMWSVGVILYMLLVGYPPFHDPNHRNMFRKIRGADYAFHDEHWNGVSTEVKQLISGLLTVSPDYRTRADEALKCKWFIMQDDALSSRDLSGSIKKFRDFHPKTTLKGAIHAARWAATAKFWNPDAISFKNQVTKWDALFAKTKPSIALDKLGTTSGTAKGITFNNAYNLKTKLRKGSMATVWECSRKDSPQHTYAVKIIKRGALNQQDDEDVMNEVAVLQSLKHTNIVELVDFYEEPDYFYLVMEYMTGGDVFDRIVEKNHYTEKNARDLIRSLLEAVKFMHDHGVAHRDLKPQNLLLKSESDDADIKVADFGFAKRVHTPQSLTTRCGTPTYVAPEILKNIPHDQAADMWSVGVICYLLLVGYPPFASENQADLFRHIRTGNYAFPEEDWGHISDLAKDLIKSLLQVEPLQRLTAVKALEHKWVTEDDDLLSSRDLSLSQRSVKEKKKKMNHLANAVRWLTRQQTTPTQVLTGLKGLYTSTLTSIASENELI